VLLICVFVVVIVVHFFFLFGFHRFWGDFTDITDLFFA